MRHRVEVRRLRRAARDEAQELREHLGVVDATGGVKIAAEDRSDVAREEAAASS
jgi:hypothetical protein